MAQTIFILGTDPEQCKERREILQERISDDIVTAHSENSLPTIKESDTVIITSEEKNSGILYRRLLNKLEEQVHRAELLSDLIRLFSSSVQMDELLDRVVSKSTDVMGDTAFIVLSGDEGQIRLESTFSKDPGRLVKMLISLVNLRSQGVGGDLLSELFTRRQPLVISNLQQANIPAELRSFVDKHSLVSLLAVPIQTKDIVLGAFVSLGAETRIFNDDDVATASALADFTAIALENAGLFAELQRTAITDPLTGAYNTRFFHEVLGRETARAERYTTPLSLLMIDVDSFKVVNDTYGHVVGNKVLTELSRTLEHTVRTTDLVFRCGGDEFGVVLPGTTLVGAMRTAEKILQKVQSSQILQSLGYACPLTVSIGVSDYKKGAHYESLVAEADQALYASKRSSKNCARAFSA